MRILLIPLALTLLALIPLFAPEDLGVPSKVDVLVVGGTPAGIAAAVTAARAGRETLLIEPGPAIGGDLTNAWLNMLDLNWAPNGMLVTQGFFLEVYGRLGQTFDLVDARRLFRDLVGAEPHLRVLTGVRASPINVTNGFVRGAWLRKVGTPVTGTIAARIVIDATDEADFVVAAGADHTTGREEIDGDTRTQAATLVFKLGGVDRDRVVAYLRKHEEPFDRGGVTERYMWGYGRILKAYRPRDRGTGAYDLNLGWQADGTVLVNALQIYNVDGTDPASVREGQARGRAELPHLIRFLRAKAPGFERAGLLSTAPELYIRETRHIVGLYRVTADDITSARDFPDRIALASYPLDLHPYAPGELNLIAPQRTIYTIPLRALVPLGLRNALVVGKAVSATRTAAGSMRIAATGMAMGEAAGQAALVALEEGKAISDIAVNLRLTRAVQRRLARSGAYLVDPNLIYLALTEGWRAGCLSVIDCRRPPMMVAQQLERWGVD